MNFITKKQAAKCFKKRKTGSFKGQNGKVLVIGGSSELVGAPALAAMSALAVLRTGTDLATVIAPQKCGFAINSISPDLIVKKVKGGFFSTKHIKTVLKECEKADAILIGPGLGLKKQTKEFAIKIAAKIKQPLVIDADAIKALQGKTLSQNCIITPHKRELEIFSGKKLPKQKELLVMQTAKKHGCIVLFKGKIDIISDGKKIFYNKTGNAGMTVGGTGDVLAGICTALAAHKVPLLEAASAAAFINGAAGDQLLKKTGIGFLASDLVKQIPLTIKKIVSGRRQKQ